MNEQLYKEIDQLLAHVSGDIIDFRVYKGATFAYLVKLATAHGRTAIGIDTFNGLNDPGREDKSINGQVFYPKGYAKASIDTVVQNIRRVCPNDPSYELHTGNVHDVLAEISPRKYAFAIVDLLHYQSTKDALDYIFSNLEKDGVIYCLNYRQGQNFLAPKAIDEFLQEHELEIHVDPLTENRISPFTSLKIHKCTANPLTLNVVEEIPHVPSWVGVPKEYHLPKVSLPTTSYINRTSKVTVAMVLRTGGDTYDYRYVNALAANIRNNLTLDFNIAVLTDNDVGMDSNLIDESIKLMHNYKGWWSKIELFRPDIFKTDRVFYLDLDTVLVSNIDDMVSYNTTFAGIRDLFHYTFLQTGIMSWNPKHNNQVYERFTYNSAKVMNDYAEGDARWIRENVYNYDYLPDYFPNRIVSYKAHCFNKETGVVSIPPEASIVCFHGKPRPHTIKNPLFTRHWKYQ